MCLHGKLRLIFPIKMGMFLRLSLYLSLNVAHSCFDMSPASCECLLPSEGFFFICYKNTYKYLISRQQANPLNNHLPGLVLNSNLQSCFLTHLHVKQPPLLLKFPWWDITDTSQPWETFVLDCEDIPARSDVLLCQPRLWLSPSSGVMSTVLSS